MPYRALQKAAIDRLSSGAPWSRAYWWNAGFSTWCCRLRMIGAGVGRSGSPTPRLITSRPAAMAAFFFLSISANR